MNQDELDIRARIIKVLRMDPKRCLSDECSTRDLMDLVCGDLILAREYIERLLRFRQFQVSGKIVV